MAKSSKKGNAHPHNQNVLWIKIMNDGHKKVKGKRLIAPEIPNDLDKIKSVLQSFILNPETRVDSISKFQKVAHIDWNDTTNDWNDLDLELIPEAYLDEMPPTIEEIRQGVEETVRDTVAFLIKTGKEGDVSDE